MLNFAPAIPPRSDIDWCGYLRHEGFVGEGLERTLHDIGVLQPGGWADWAPSSMTDTGSPVEMLLTAHQSSLALRTEVDNPACDPIGRVAKTCAIIKKLGGTLPPTSLREVISVAQSTSPLQFGAWLGLRQSAKGLFTTLHAELPASARDLLNLCLPKVLTDTLG